jgi:hypothetical protein
VKMRIQPRQPAAAPATKPAPKKETN